MFQAQRIRPARPQKITLTRAHNQQLAPRCSCPPAEKPKQLPRYFKDLELLFEHTKIVADADKKRYATFYLEVEVAEVWEELPEFHSANKMYEEFKAAVIVMYPSADAKKRYTRVDVDQHVTKWRNRGIHSLNDWAEFYCEFQAMCSWLCSRNRIQRCVAKPR